MREIYLQLRPEDIAYVKFVIESYETVGIIRTVDRGAPPTTSVAPAPSSAEPAEAHPPTLKLRRIPVSHSSPDWSRGRSAKAGKKAVIVFLVVEDFLPVARGLVAALRDEVGLSEIPRPPDVGDDWLMNELAVENNSRMED